MCHTNILHVFNIIYGRPYIELNVQWDTPYVPCTGSLNQGIEYTRRISRYIKLGEYPVIVGKLGEYPGMVGKLGEYTGIVGKLGEYPGIVGKLGEYPCDLWGFCFKNIHY